MINRSARPDPKSLEEILREARSAGWQERENAARALIEHLADPAAFQQLIRMLDDADTAVVEEATESLVQAGLVGLREVLTALHDGANDAGAHIQARLAALWLDGAPILDWCRALAVASEAASVRHGASEMIEKLVPGKSGGTTAAGDG